MNPQFAARWLVPFLIVAVAGCGGGDDTPDGASAGSGAEASESVTAASAAEPAENAGSGTGTGGGSATVTIDGTTYEFASESGSTTVCKDIYGTLQILLPYIDETGQPADGPELSMIALQPGIDNDQTRDAYVELNLPTGDIWVAGESGLAEILEKETVPLTAAADGSSFSATVTLSMLYDSATRTDATIDVTCS